MITVLTAQATNITCQYFDKISKAFTIPTPAGIKKRAILSHKNRATGFICPGFTPVSYTHLTLPTTSRV